MVPHIGFTARTKFTSRETLRDRSSPNPDYDYDVETQLVIDRLEELASDDRQKMLVEFFDNKLSVGVSILLAMDALIGWTYEER